MKDNKILTRNQKLVFEALKKQSQPLSVYDILKHLSSKTTLSAPLTIYRALDTLIARGLVHRIEKLRAFYACTRDNCDNSHSSAFLICEACNKVRELDYQQVKNLPLAKEASKQGFEVDSVYLEIAGKCMQCLEVEAEGKIG